MQQAAAAPGQARRRRRALPTTLKAFTRIILSTVLLSACALGQEPAKPVVYNNAEGDGSLELDREIKAAYSARFTIVDTRRSEGFVEPSATAGSLPRFARDAEGRPLVGYVRVAYVVTAAGLVAEPVALRATDRRLIAAATDAMKDWRFAPGKLNGAAVATTAAQEFNFGPADFSNGFATDRLIMYQTSDILLRRAPGPDEFGAYYNRLKSVAHNFFVGVTTPEALQIVVVMQPGRHSRVWFVSSTRAGDAKELEPLRRLLEAVTPVEVREGPVAFAISAEIAGGDGRGPAREKKGGQPVPKEWQDAAKALEVPLPVSSDGYLNLVWREAR
jgi:hypothetical protein